MKTILDSNKLETRNILEGLESIILHMSGFNDKGKTKRLLYRNHFAFGTSKKDIDTAKRMHNLGLINVQENDAQHGLGYYIGPRASLTKNGIFEALKLASFRTCRKCCYHCSNLGYAFDDDGFELICEGRAYRNDKEEYAHTKQMEDNVYLYRAKKCYDGVFNVDGME